MISSVFRSASNLFNDLQWIARSPWVPASRISMAARLTFLSAMEGFGVPLHSSGLAHGLKVEFSSLGEYLTLYREIFIRQDYGLPLSSSKPVIIDCGANIGMATMYFKRRFPESRIIAFEPAPESFRRLTANIQRNGLQDVELRNAAVGSTDGTVMLVRQKGSAESLAASIALSSTNGSVSVPIQCVRLSGVIESLGNVDLLKLDIEGAEYDVLDELDQSGCLSRVGCIIIEYHEGVAKAPVQDALSLLARNGFKCRLAGIEWKPWYVLSAPYAAMIYAVRPADQ